MRQIILDTETTGLNPKTGDRILEIGCVELVNRRLTGNTFHHYINPERDSDPGALAVHGLSTDFLSDKPKFADIAEELRSYLRGAHILIHNVPFDVGFLDAEFARLKWAKFAEISASIQDTLVMAKELHPGKRNSLDALCERYGVSNAHRTLHGALLDAELLAEVYLAMTRGQDSLVMDIETPVTAASTATLAAQVQDLPVLRASAEELAAHEALLDKLAKESKGVPVWRRTLDGGATS